MKTELVRRNPEEIFDTYHFNGIRHGFDQATKLCHELAYNAGWWHDIYTGEPLDRNVGEMFMLMVTELAEGFEGTRKDLMDDHLPDRKAVEVELADCIIRILDFAGKNGYDIGGAMLEKLRYNTSRADHKVENRQKPGGKKC